MRVGRRLLIGAILIAPLVCTALLVPAWAQAVQGGSDAAAAAGASSPEVMKWGFIAAALVTGSGRPPAPRARTGARSARAARTRSA